MKEENWLLYIFHTYIMAWTHLNTHTHTRMHTHHPNKLHAKQFHVLTFHLNKYVKKSDDFTVKSKLLPYRVYPNLIQDLELGRPQSKEGASLKWLSLQTTATFGRALSIWMGIWRLAEATSGLIVHQNNSEVREMQMLKSGLLWQENTD